MSLLKNTFQPAAQSKTILPFSNRLLGFLSVQKDTLLFTANYEGKDEIWAYIDGDLPKGPFRMNNYVTGLYQAALTGDQLVASAFTADGYRLGKFTPTYTKPNSNQGLSTLFVDGLFTNSDHQMLNTVKVKKDSVTNYPKSFQFFNFHSYRPNYAQPEYSFTLYGQNILNTFQSNLTYTYNQNEKSHKFGYEGIFGGNFLQPVFGINQTFHRAGLVKLNKDTIANWNESIGYAGVQLPLNLSGGKEYRYLTLLTTYHVDQIRFTGFATKYFADPSVQYLNTRISFSTQIQKAVQQIFPHWAQSWVLQYKKSLNGIQAQQGLLSGSLFFPGLANNHSLVITGAIQGRDTLRQYGFTNNFPFARGYTSVDFPVMWKWGLNYHFPIGYFKSGLYVLYGNILL